MQKKKTDRYLNYSLTKGREEGFYDEEYVNPLPRAVIRPNAFIMLDGDWNFALDTEDKGMSETWYIQHEYSHTANWPGTVESELLKHQPSEPSWQDKIVVWYEREFPLPVFDNEDDQNCSIMQLTFGACGYETRVWLNGLSLKTIEGEEVHMGEYTSFSYELDQAMLQDVNRLTVRVANSMDADNTRGKQESAVYKRGGIWYQTYSGAVRSVWIEAVERNRLRSRLGVVSIVEDDLVRFSVSTRIHDPGEYTIRLKVYEKHQKPSLDAPIASDEYPLVLALGQKQQRLVIEVPGAQLWSPETPHLYRLIAELVDSKGRGSTIESYFGLRKIEARGCCIYLNNKVTYLDGILYQPGIASYDQIQKHMYAMKALGCNLVRIHIAGVDPRIYNLADKLGMLLWVEVPSPHRSTVKSRENHKAELLRMLSLIATHPSVIIWSLYNEDWGAQDIAHNEETRDYIIEMYHYMKLAYPQFLVVDNDGWQHISYEGRLKSDLLTAHLYTPEAETWDRLLDELVMGKQIGVTAFPLVVGDPYFYRKQVPLLVSEWGGFGFVGYGGPNDDAQRTTQIKKYKDALRKRDIAGDVYTQATNIEEESNGLIDFSTGELTVPAGLLNSRDRSAFDGQV
ncbi:MAG: sugar-binding domain-containing protein [Pedobacter sp.]